MIAYKLMTRRKDGTLGPLFINRKLRIPLDTWLRAGAHETKGYAFRPGWHCLTAPKAPHLKDGVTTNRVWVEVNIEDYTSHWRGEHQGGQWYLAQRMKVLRIFKSNMDAHVAYMDYQILLDMEVDHQRTVSHLLRNVA